MKRLSANCVGTDAPAVSRAPLDRLQVRDRTLGHCWVSLRKYSTVRYNRFLIVGIAILREAYALFAGNIEAARRADHAAPEKPSCECRRPLSIKANPGHTLTTDKLH